LNETFFPSLEELLRNVTRWGELMTGQGCSARYAKVCKAIAKRLFGGKESERAELKKKMVEEWTCTLTGEEKHGVEDALAGKKGADDDDDEEDSDDEDDGKPWYASGVVKDENMKASDPESEFDEPGADFSQSSELTFSTVYKTYKKSYAQVPNVPLRGPPKWDLSKWTRAEKAQFSFDNMDDED
jgi:hypothetical protein